MATLNTAASKAKTTLLTHEGATAKRISAEQELRRTVMACMLWEDTFYESGVAVADRIKDLVSGLPGKVVAKIAIEARNQMKLRHVPLLLARELARHPDPDARIYVADTLAEVIQRPDELTEYLAIYWKDGKEPLSAQSKKGLARAFAKFNEYSLAKYSSNKAVKLRDVLFLSHARPKDTEQVDLFKKVVDNTLQVPDTWEVALSAGADKKEVFTRLIVEDKLGALALLRNLRNMDNAGVDPLIVKGALATMKVDKVLPFRFITAARYAPKFEPQLEAAMLKALTNAEKLPGKTVLLVDRSGSMIGTPVSARSELDRSDAASALAILLREICEDVDVVAFSNDPVLVPARHGFALRDAIAQHGHGGTYTEKAKLFADKLGYDRIIIITDEQSHETISAPKDGAKGYVINVATYQNGIGYGKWNHIDGWSEAVVDYIREFEKL